MPTLYEYLGIIIKFFSNEHLPIHVHGIYQDYESKAEIFVKEGNIHEIIYSKIKDRKELPLNKLKDFEKFVEAYSEEIVQKWIDYFVLQKNIESKKITKRIK